MQCSWSSPCTCLSASWFFSFCTSSGFPGDRQRRHRHQPPRLRAKARFLWHLRLKGLRTLNCGQLANIWNRLQAHRSRDPVWLCRIKEAMWKAQKDPWRCLNCSKLNRYNINCCGDCGGHWEEFLGPTFVPPSRQQQQKQAQSSSAQPTQWESSRRTYTTWNNEDSWQEVH